MKTKRLELFLLAGCSCLITLLAQPIASAIAYGNSVAPASPPTLPNLQAPKPAVGAFCSIKSKSEYLQTDRTNG
ncbi:hypothetical protein ACQ4M3_24895 [Leptolyngbya sp. AN03gr2]|uniref:hypothetical protein n=1 Tax=unclassified Leptolyngbya TaxID=2650499 RepID=UPI003D31E6C0